MSYFNVRVYGLLVNEHNQVLLSDEEAFGKRFTKFPGGGLEYGEGLIDALKREFVEECNTEIEVVEHVYTTDFFEKSSFNDSQIISVYYKVKLVDKLNVKVSTEAFDFTNESKQSFRWKNICDISAEDVTFKTDKEALIFLQ